MSRRVNDESDQSISGRAAPKVPACNFAYMYTYVGVCTFDPIRLCVMYIAKLSLTRRRQIDKCTSCAKTRRTHPPVEGCFMCCLIIYQNVYMYKDVIPATAPEIPSSPMPMSRTHIEHRHHPPERPLAFSLTENRE